MRTLVLGATGFIGCSITDELIAHDHEVVALARSPDSAAELAKKGASVVRGDIRQPEPWCAIVHEVDAIIHVAATFSDDMGDIDRHLVEALKAQVEKADKKLRFLYTGGCWLFGQTGNTVADENSVYDPFPPFSWMIENSRVVFAATCFDTMMIHPAMVYDRDGGAISTMLTSAHQTGRVEVWGALETRWPVIHREDLGTAYRLVLESGTSEQSYCVEAEQSVRVGDIATVMSQRLGLKDDPRVLSPREAVAIHGQQARGPALDQQMSGEKIKNTLGWVPKYKSILSEIR